MRPPSRLEWLLPLVTLRTKSLDVTAESMEEAQAKVELARSGFEIVSCAPIGPPTSCILNRERIRHEPNEKVVQEFSRLCKLSLTSCNFP